MDIELKSIRYAIFNIKGVSKKTVIFLLVVLFCFAGLTACTGPSDLTKGKTAEQIAEEAFDGWYGLDNLI